MADKKKQKQDKDFHDDEEITSGSSETTESGEGELVEDKTAVRDDAPAKKIIYAEIDDEVTTVYDKIKGAKSKEIYIVFPKRSVIFQSIVNLKILKKKAESHGKTIFFVTNDKNGIYLASAVGITVYDKATEGKPSLFSTESGDEKLRITPLKASVNSVEEDTPTRAKERKLSISELLRKDKNKTNIDVTKLTTPKIKEKKDKPRFVLVAPNRHALIGLVVLSVFILLAIVYVALPGVTIYLTPSASVLEKSVNITLADFNQNKAELDTRPPHMIASYPIDVDVKKTITVFATGKKFSSRGANATGSITIYNTTPEDWPLMGKTRFQTNEGIVFRITGPVTVPGATAQGAGKIDAFVMADISDAYGGIVGDRGNLAPSKFYLPGLKDDSRSKIYAVSTAPMTGGVTDFISFIAKEDVEAAKAKMADELNKTAIEELRKAVAAKTKLVEDSTSYVLLEGDKAVKTGEVSVTIPPDLENQELKQFDVTGQVHVSGVYYEKQAMLTILKDELMLKKSPEKDLLRINEDSTSYRIFEWDDQRGKIKLTANIKGIEQYAIDPEKENGQRLLKKVRDHIAGKAIEEAKVYIQNLPEINKVEVDSWPAWAPTIPKLPDNIKFEIRDAAMVE